MRSISRHGRDSFEGNDGDNTETRTAAEQVERRSDGAIAFPQPGLEEAFPRASDEHPPHGSENHPGNDMPAASVRRNKPLVLDLDGTLINTDMLHESALAYLRENPLRIFILLFWMLTGKAALKSRLARHAHLDPQTLPVNSEVVAYAEARARAGDEVVLATAADAFFAHAIARRFPFIDRVIASDGVTNLKGRKKADVLAETFPDGFDYAGDSKADLPVWEKALGLIVVGASPKTERAAGRIGEPLLVIPRRPRDLMLYAKSLRLHQWVKNALIFVPLILGGKFMDVLAWQQAIIGFIGLGILASTTYVINDLWDLQDDRKHWSKRNRPLASGALPLSHAITLIPLGLAASFALVSFAGLQATAVLAGYLVLTLLYSMRLKREPILDVFVLAALFTARLVFGVVLAGVAWSAWLLLFSMFVFFSLSSAKRHTEVIRMAKHSMKQAAGRGYLAEDAPLLLAFGSASAFGAVLIMTLYIINDAFNEAFYSLPVLLWTFPAILFLWMGRVWLLCHRGVMQDDPVTFAVRDRTSLALGATMVAAFAAAAFSGNIV